MKPSWLRAMRKHVASPRPRAFSLVVKNGSKMRVRCVSGMPRPSSRTLRRTYSPAGSGSVESSVRCTASPRTWISAPPGEACRALVSSS